MVGRCGERNQGRACRSQSKALSFQGIDPEQTRQMRGIEGGFSFRTELPVENVIVARLNEFHRHPGPDGGVWASDDQRVVLGHRRLAIVETGRLGNQTQTDMSRRE
jgi:hypothetical protein